MANKGKTKGARYAYTLVNRQECGDDNVVSDYVMAADMQAAYDIAVSVCDSLNKKYGISYSVQSVMPN